ncbi:Signal recognition particle receptor FtsY [Candidatus Tiddalikarchaeum anstoanum]|nr:Signal recognition particle receptor FtsY [Candidatus Tiddalikarchaeum anstoanum]
MFDFLKKKLGEIFKGVEKTVNDATKSVEKTITEAKLDRKTFDSIFWNFEMALLENNVSSEVVDNVKLELGNKLVNTSVKRDFKKVIFDALRSAFGNVLFEVKIDDFLAKVRSKKPFIIMFVGINGSGKTTNLSKLASFLKKNKLSCVIAAGDTFRAASIEQLKIHGDNLGIKVVNGEYGCDSASVAFDAVKHAESSKLDVVLIDTAGRLQSDTNLMDELLKIKRVAKPDCVIFVADSLTGNDVVEQAKVFDKKIGVDYVILSKSDVDSKGGAVLSVGYAIKKPIIFLGTGQSYNDLKPFSKSEILDKLFKQ